MSITNRHNNDDRENHHRRHHHHQIILVRCHRNPGATAPLGSQQQQNQQHGPNQLFNIIASTRRDRFDVSVVLLCCFLSLVSSCSLILFSSTVMMLRHRLRGAPAVEASDGIVQEVPNWLLLSALWSSSMQLSDIGACPVSHAADLRGADAGLERRTRSADFWLPPQAAAGSLCREVA